MCIGAASLFVGKQTLSVFQSLPQRRGTVTQRWFHACRTCRNFLSHFVVGLSASWRCVSICVLLRFSNLSLRSCWWGFALKLGAWNIYGPPPGATLSPEIHWMLPATSRAVHICKVSCPTDVKALVILLFLGEIYAILLSQFMHVTCNNCSIMLLKLWRLKLILIVTINQPIPVAARSEAWVCGRALARTAVLILAGGMGVSVFWVLCVLSVRGLCDGLITCPEKSYRVWCVCVSVIEEPDRGGLALLGLSRHEKKN
jgi:hypothetical protein